MDVLVLGGTVFLGRAVVSEAQALGANVTIFNRGKSGPRPDGVAEVIGDRTVADDLEQLAGRRFDVVVDTCGYVPADVRLSAELLAPTSGHYAFVSSINVFPGWPEQADYREDGLHQGDPDATRADVSPELSESESYGWLKAGCELTAVRAFGADRTAVLRGGCIVGPHDSAVGRLAWWIARVSRGGEVLVPGCADDPMSLIDARDLAAFALSGAAGAFEAAGPPARDTRGDLMAACQAATGSDARFTYVGDDWLAAQDVAAWTEVPLWVPGSPGAFAPHTAEAEAAGLTWRPLGDTVADTWAWQQGFPGGWRPNERTPGLAPEREVGLLAAWHAR
ncbi:MAG: NAD-dependent epimerase [Pseudonocardiales bacterium]|nr:MAG: NAD-dependent epimerase [Pseudonocardiales bacterium]